MLVKTLIKIRKSAIESWIAGAGINQTQLSRELNIDPGNFSKILAGELEPTKSFMKNLMCRTGYTFDMLFELLPDNH